MRAQEARPADPAAANRRPRGAAIATPAAAPVSHDAAIIRLRSIAYGKDEDGNYLRPSVRVREAAKEALKQVVTQQIQEEEAAKAGPNSQAATAVTAGNAVTNTNYNQSPPPAGTNSGDAIPATPAETAGGPSLKHGSSAASDNWFLPELFDGKIGYRLTNFDEGFSPMQSFGVSPNQPFSPGQIGPAQGRWRAPNLPRNWAESLGPWRPFLPVPAVR